MCGAKNCQSTGTALVIISLTEVSVKTQNWKEFFDENLQRWSTSLCVVWIGGKRIPQPICISAARDTLQVADIRTERTAPVEVRSIRPVSIKAAAGQIGCSDPLIITCNSPTWQVPCASYNIFQLKHMFSLSGSQLPMQWSFVGVSFADLTSAGEVVVYVRNGRWPSSSKPRLAAEGQADQSQPGAVSGGLFRSSRVTRRLPLLSPA